MSLMNCFIAPDHALIAVDTHVMGPDRQIHASKLLILPHANAALAMRGELMFFSWAFNALQMSMAQNFDALAEATPEILAQTYAQRVQLAEKMNAPFAGLEIALVGWSDALARMQGVRWERWPDDKGFRVTPIDPWSMSPDPGYTDTPVAPDTAERMESIARAQVHRLGRLPCVAIGGRLLLAEVTRDAAHVRTVANLEARQ